MPSVMDDRMNALLGRAPGSAFNAPGGPIGEPAYAAGTPPPMQEMDWNPDWSQRFRSRMPQQGFQGYGGGYGGFGGGQLQQMLARLFSGYSGGGMGGGGRGWGGGMGSGYGGPMRGWGGGGQMMPQEQSAGGGSYPTANPPNQGAYQPQWLGRNQFTRPRMAY